MYMKIILKNGKLTNFDFLPSEIAKLWPLISRFQLIFRPWFFSTCCFLWDWLSTHELFLKILDIDFWPYGRFGPKMPPVPPIWHLGHRIWIIGWYRNYLSFRRVISIEKLSWATFPVSAWVCDQLLAYNFVDMLSFRKFFFVIVSLAKPLLWRWHENQNSIWMFWQLCVLCFQKLLLILAWKTLQKTM